MKKQQPSPAITSPPRRTRSGISTRSNHRRDGGDGSTVSAQSALMAPRNRKYRSRGSGSMLPVSLGRVHGVILILLLVMVAGPSAVHAQFKAFQKISATQGNFNAGLDDGDDFGESVTWLGDLDLDGIPDMAVTAEDDDDGGSNRGAVYILFLNSDGTVKSHRKISQTAGGFTGQLDDEDELGNWITTLGDLDGDGVVDIAVAAIGDDDGGLDRGAIWIIFLNRDGTAKGHQKISGTQGGFTGILDDRDCFGCALEGLGDFDQDGIPDLAAGTQRDDDGGLDRGAVWLLTLNADGTVKNQSKISNTAGGFTGELQDGDGFGQSVAAIGDVDGDGVTDLAVGAEDDDDGGLSSGAVWLLRMNADGTVKQSSKISNTFGNFSGGLDAGDQFGQSVESLGDYDNDGFPDLAVGAEFDSDSGKPAGAAWLLSLNADGTVNSHFKINDNTPGFVGQLEPWDEFGQDITTIGDLDGDGLAEIAVTADADNDGGDHKGAVYVFFLQDRATLAPTMESGRLSGVDHQWTTVSLGNRYTSPVIVASPLYDDRDSPHVVRMRNVNAQGFDVRVVDTTNPSASISGIGVTYTALEAGVYTLASYGLTMEARCYQSTVTDHPDSWVGQHQLLTNSFANPVVLGQVMTENDTGFSVFWCRGAGRSQAPTGAFLYTGKHVGEDADTTRADETIGYMVLEAGSYGRHSPQLVAGVTPPFIAGVGDAPPYLHPFRGMANVTGAVAAQQAMRGNEGSWALLYGTDPISETALHLAVDEDQHLDAERNHTAEQVAFLLISQPDGDLDGDGDVDGVDLAAYIANPAGLPLAAFAAAFGSVISGQSNQAPVVDPIGDQAATENHPLAVAVTASDVDGPPPLILSAADLPPGATFTDNGDGSGIFAWTPAVGDSVASPYTVTFSATEDNGNGLSTPQAISITVSPESVNLPPVLDPIGDQAATEDQLLTVVVSAADPDGTAPLVIDACGLPENASFVDNGDGTGIFTWLPAVGDATAAGIPVTITVTDNNGTGISASETFIVDVQPAQGLVEGFLQDSGPQGIVSMEAEQYDANHPFPPHSWTATSTAGFSGSGAMQATPNTGVNISDGYAPLNSPRLDFRVNFVHTGIHYVWVRGIGTTTGNDSIHIGLDSAAVPTARRLQQFDPSWTWSNSAFDEVAGVHLAATIDIQTAGVHTINAWMREDGFIVDKLVLTTDPGFVPAGTGPPQSPSVAAILPLPFAEAFDQGPPVDWQVVDEAGNPSAWVVSGGSYQQLNQVRSSSRENLIESYHIGSLAYLTTGIGLHNYRATFDMTPLAETGDDIGCIVRYQNPYNYYRFSMDSRYGYTRLEKRVAGQFTSLAANAIGYERGRTYRIAVTVIHDKLFVSMDDALIFAVQDASLSSGTFAFYSAAAVQFDNLALAGMDHAPAIGIEYPLSRSVVVPSTFQASANGANAPCDSRVHFLLDGNLVDVIHDAPYVTQFASVAQGTHLVQTVLVDGQGATAVSDQRVMVGVGGDYYAATGDSITNGAYDTYQADNVDPGNPGFSFQGYPGPLGRMLTEANQYPSIVVNEAVGGDESGDLLALRIDSILARNPGLNRLTLLIGTNDSGSSLPATRAVFAANLQEIVNKVKTIDDAITVTVGITPPAFGLGSTGSIYADPLAPSAARNVLIRDYRDAITQDLAGIAIGPDFFACFLEERNLFSLFVDNVHPNGLGYDVMARLWHEVLTGARAPTDVCTLPRFILQNLEPSTTAPYIKQNLIEVGDSYYTDEAHTVSAIPSGLGLEDGIWIMTPNSDAAATDSTYITFDGDRAVDVYVAYDLDPGNPLASTPDWMSGYTDTGATLQVSDAAAQFRLFRQAFPPGQIVLGGNLAPGANGANVNYIAIVVEH